MNCVAIPYDYNQSKIRVCEYEVLGTCEAEDKSLLANHSNDFAVNPIHENLCDGCDEHVDYCTCGDEDDDYEPDYCENCGDTDCCGDCDDDDNECPDCGDTSGWCDCDEDDD
jgi:hypothetical protein